ncbi:Uncharacterised protein [Serratia fonticola]|uniref:Uncharacterized protein n=1 Tax=Serratia fonticola TaxID=47917 RepID=A0A4U9WNW2_SERFO|nr:Uncharacterised protein [Serratia fonticola]
MGLVALAETYLRAALGRNDFQVVAINDLDRQQKPWLIF